MIPSHVCSEKTKLCMNRFDQKWISHIFFILERVHTNVPKLNKI